MELSKQRRGNEHISLGCRFGVFSSLLAFNLPIPSLITPKYSTLQPVVHHPHPTHMEDPSSQTTHSHQMPQPPMGRSQDLTCQGCRRRNHDVIKGHRRRYRNRRRRRYGSWRWDRTAAVAYHVRTRREGETDQPDRVCESGVASCSGRCAARKVEGEVWQDLAFPSNEMGDDDAELAVGGSRFRHWEEEDECSNVHPQTAFQTRFIVFVHPFLAYLRRLYSWSDIIANTSFTTLRHTP